MQAEMLNQRRRATKPHRRTLLQSCDFLRGLSRDASAQAAVLAAKECRDDGWRRVVSRRVPGFVGAFISVCYGRAGDPAFVHQSEAHAVLRGDGSYRVACGMHLAIFAGKKRRRSIFPSPCGRKSGNDQELGGAIRFFECFYSGHSSAAAAVQTICIGGGSFPSSAADFCDGGIAWAGAALRCGRGSRGGVWGSGAGFFNVLQPRVCALGGGSPGGAVHRHAFDVPPFAGEELTFVQRCRIRKKKIRELSRKRSAILRAESEGCC